MAFNYLMGEYREKKSSHGDNSKKKEEVAIMVPSHNENHGQKKVFSPPEE